MNPASSSPGRDKQFSPRACLSDTIVRAHVCSRRKGAAGTRPGSPGQHRVLEGPGGGLPPHPGRSGGNKLCLPPGSGSKSSTSTREGSDSRPPKTRKFHAGAKIVAGLPGRAPSSHALQPLSTACIHTRCPRGLNYGGTELP